MSEPYPGTRLPLSGVSRHPPLGFSLIPRSAIEVDEDSAPYAVAGQNVTLYLSGIDPIHLAIGTVLCPTSLPVPLVTRLTAQILVFDLQTPIIAGTSVGRFDIRSRYVKLMTVGRSSCSIIR